MTREVSFSQIVTVRSRYTRSVALVRDWWSDDAIEGYLLTPSGRDTLGRLASALRGESPSRAWSVTGPYGSGKSSLALFAAQALCGSGVTGDQARATLKAHAHVLWKMLFHGDGPLVGELLCPVLVTGSRGPLEHSLAAALLGSLRRHTDHPPRSMIKQLEAIASGRDSGEQTSRLVNLFEDALKTVTGGGRYGRGILLIIDELGKFLEHAASHPETGDLFVLQTLAEAAARAEQPFLIVTILHQTMDRYAAHVSVTRRQEWAKVQTRFEDIAFEEPAEQLLRLLAAALERQGPEGAQRLLEKRGRDLASTAWTLGCRSGKLDHRAFLDLLTACVPLHPTVALLLGPLFKRLAQNERSLFAFLTSGEPFAFQEFLTSEPVRPDFETYRLDRLYDYVTTALGSALYSQHRGKHWAEVQSALDRLHDASPIEVRVAKAIGLVQAVGFRAGAPTSTEFLQFALGGQTADKDIAAAVTALERRSVIVYRRHADSYALWEGSDVNIESRMEEARRAVDPARHLTSYLEDLAPPTTLVARRHSYKTGTLRFFDVCYANGETLACLLARDIGSADGQVIYCLPLTTEERQRMVATLETITNPMVIAVLPGEVRDLKEACHELACLQWVAEHTPELAGDATARRELRARLAAAEHSLRAQIRQVFLPTSYSKCRWFYQGEPRSFFSPRHLHDFLSTVCDRVYVCTPCWQNELINRRSLSSAAAAARRNLIEAMIEHPAEEALGIRGTPPERSMYDSILARAGLHRRDAKGWGFRPPREQLDPALAGVWKAVHTFFRAAEGAQQPVDDLFTQLRAAPFGLKDGVLPVLLAAALLYYDAEVALYEEKTFVPSLTTAVFERILRSPERFELQYCRVVGPRALVFTKYAAMLSSATGRTGDDKPTLLKVVRPLLKFTRQLPEYVGNTQKVSEVARAVLRILKESRQPDHMLFTALPVACGAEPFRTCGAPRQKQIEAYFGTLRAALAELQQAYPRLQGEIGQLVLHAFGLTGPLTQARQELTDRAKLVSELAVDPKLRSFLVRVADDASDDLVWVESLAALLAGKPSRSWMDEDRARFEVSLALTARTFHHFEALAFEMEQKGAPILDGDDHALRVAVTVPHHPEIERVVRIPARLAVRAGKVREEIQRLLAAADLLENRELSAAILANVVRELLVEDSKEQE